MKIDFEATSGNYLISANDIGVTILEKHGNVVLNIFRYLNNENIFVDDAKEKGYLDGYKFGYTNGVHDCEILHDGGLELSENVRRIFGLEEKKDEKAVTRWDSTRINTPDIEDNFLLFQGVKEKPKTFGWDEAYRLMKEGKKVSRLLWKTSPYFCKYIHISEGSIRQDSMDTLNTFLIEMSELDAPDWCVYEE